MTTLKACSIDGCDSPHFGRSWCKAHYTRWRRHGDPVKTVRSPAGAALAWIKNVADNPPEGCAVWPFPTNDTGYGQLRWEGGKIAAHRLALVLHSGRNPRELFASHGPCHNPVCCNPLHLSWQTPKENTADRLRDGTDNRGVKHNLAKLSDSDVIAIRQDGRPQRVIANSYGVNQALIWRIKHRKIWRHVA